MPTITSTYTETITLESRYFVDNWEDYEQGDVHNYISRGPYSDSVTITLPYDLIPADEKVNSVILSCSISGGGITGVNVPSYMNGILGSGASALSAKIGTQTVSMRNLTAKYATNDFAGTSSKNILLKYCITNPSYTEVKEQGASTSLIGSYGWHYSDITISNITLTIIYGESSSGSTFSLGRSFQIGVNDIARDVKDLWIGDENGIARKAKRIWIGDENGKAKYMWPADRIYPTACYQINNTSAGVANPATLIASNHETASYRRGFILEFPDLSTHDFDMASIHLHLKGMATNSSYTSFGGGYSSTFPVLVVTAITPGTIKTYANMVSGIDTQYSYRAPICGYNTSANTGTNQDARVLCFSKESFEDVMLMNGTPQEGKIWLWFQTNSSAGYGYGFDGIADDATAPYIQFYHASYSEYDTKRVWRFRNPTRTSSTNKYFTLTCPTGGFSASDNFASIGITIRYEVNLATEGSSSSATKYTLTPSIGYMESSAYQNVVTLPATTGVWHSIITHQAMTTDDQTIINHFRNNEITVRINSTSSSTNVPAGANIEVEVYGIYA